MNRYLGVPDFETSSCNSFLLGFTIHSMSGGTPHKTSRFSTRQERGLSKSASLTELTPVTNRCLIRV